MRICNGGMAPLASKVQERSSNHLPLNRVVKLGRTPAGAFVPGAVAQKIPIERFPSGSVGAAEPPERLPVATAPFTEASGTVTDRYRRLTQGVEKPSGHCRTTTRPHRKAEVCLSTRLPSSRERFWRGFARAAPWSAGSGAVPLGPERAWEWCPLPKP
jgi:hypothetical protein